MGKRNRHSRSPERFRSSHESKRSRRDLEREIDRLRASMGEGRHSRHRQLSRSSDFRSVSHSTNASLSFRSPDRNRFSTIPLSSHRSCTSDRSPGDTVRSRYSRSSASPGRGPPFLLMNQIQGHAPIETYASAILGIPSLRSLDNLTHLLRARAPYISHPWQNRNRRLYQIRITI